jgi:hypothetical protein
MEHLPSEASACGARTTRAGASSARDARTCSNNTAEARDGHATAAEPLGDAEQA